MPSAEERIDEARRAAAALPGIVDALASRKEAVEIAGEAARTHGVSESTAFAWVIAVEERFLEKRRSIAVAGNLLLGPSTVIAIAGILLVALGNRDALGALCVAVGSTGALAGARLLARSREIAAKAVRRGYESE